MVPWDLFCCLKTFLFYLLLANFQIRNYDLHMTINNENSECEEHDYFVEFFNEMIHMNIFCLVLIKFLAYVV